MSWNLTSARSRQCMTTSPTFFFFNDTATTEIYTLSLHDALPISRRRGRPGRGRHRAQAACPRRAWSICPCRRRATMPRRSEEHTSELQSQSNLVCRLLLEKKKKKRSAALPRHPARTRELHDRLPG